VASPHALSEGMPSWSAPLVGPGLVVDLSRARDISMRITFAALEGALATLDGALDSAFDAAFADDAPPQQSSAHATARAFSLPGATTSAVQAGSFVGDVRRGGSCNCETHVITPHGDGTHTEGVGHILHDRVPVLDLVDTGLVPALVVTVAPVRLDSVEDDVVGNHAPTDRVVDELTLSEAVARALTGAPHVKARALVVRTAPGAQRRAQMFSGTNPPYFTVDAATWVTGHGFEHLLIDLPSLDREDDGGLLAAHRAFFDVPARSVHLRGPAPRRTITEMIAVDVDGPHAVADGLYALSLQLAPLVADAVPSRPLLYPLVAAHASWLRQERT
jgi:arylformamidase